MDDRYRATLTLGPDGPGVSLLLTQAHFTDVAGLMWELGVRDAEDAREATLRTVPDGTTRETLQGLYRLAESRLEMDYADATTPPAVHRAALTVDATITVLEQFHKWNAIEDDIEAERNGSM